MNRIKNSLAGKGPRQAVEKIESSCQVDDVIIPRFITDRQLATLARLASRRPRRLLKFTRLGLAEVSLLALPGNDIGRLIRLIGGGRR
jgi:hypothetical protein